jgi:hypothetical protein
MQTIADIAGDNAVHVLSTANISASVVYLGAAGGPMRVGDLAHVGSARGVSVPTGGVLTLHGMDTPLGGHQLSTIAVYVPSGTTLTIAYEE